MSTRSSSLALAVGLSVLAASALAGPLDDLMKQAEKKLLDAAKKPPSGGVPTEDKSKGETPTPAKAPTRSEAKRAPEVSLDGEWYSDSYGIGIRISDGKGVSTIDDKIGHKAGQPVLRLSPAEPGLYRGQMWMDKTRGHFEWLDVKVAIRGETLGIGLQDQRQISLSRHAPPRLSDPLPSGARYIVGSCAPGTFTVAVTNPVQADFKKLPAFGKFPLNEAPEPLRAMLLEAHEFTRSACGENALRGQYPVFFQSTPLPALPLAVSDFDKAAAKAYISAGTATFSNQVVADVMEAKKIEQRKAQENAVAARAEQGKLEREAFAKKFNAVELPRMQPLYANPFALEGKAILVSGHFQSMESRTTALFSANAHGLSDYAGTLVVSDVPAELVGEPVDTLLVVRVLGQVKHAEVASGKAPSVKYLGHLKCSTQQSQTLSC